MHRQERDDHIPLQHPALDPAIEAATLEALESKPHPVIPTGFAARMALLAKAEPVRRPRARTHYGQTAAWLSLAILTAMVVALAPIAISSGPLTLTPLAAVEYLLLAQLLALALWLGTRTFPGTN